MQELINMVDGLGMKQRRLEKFEAISEFRYNEPTQTKKQALLDLLVNYIQINMVEQNPTNNIYKKSSNHRLSSFNLNHSFSEHRGIVPEANDYTRKVTQGH